MNRLIRITAAASLLALFQSGSLAAQPAASLTKGATYGTGTTLELRFDQPTTVSHIITMEDIRQGHIIRTYEVDGLVDGQWQKLVEGQSVGYKKIDVIKAATVSAFRALKWRNRTRCGSGLRNVKTSSWGRGRRWTLS